MKIYKYWVREKVSVKSPRARRPFDIEVCGGSERDLEDAREQARAVAVRVRQAIESGRPPMRYLYSDRPLREEVLDELRHRDEVIGLITRNSYGSRVLNTAKAMFIDIDMEGGRNIMTGERASTHPWFSAGEKNPPKSFLEKVQRFFRSDSEERREEAFEAALKQIEREVARHSRLAMRVYRTFGGYRCLVTDRTFKPSDSRSKALLESFKSDPLYIKLCTVQECYRARLTPKYWRFSGNPPPARFPFRDHKDEDRYRRWEERYEREIHNYSTCVLVASFGSGVVDDRVKPVVELHDRIACGISDELA
jgi:hypothetical protein